MKKDMLILEFIENKIDESRGNEQQKWVNKYDIFTNESFFRECNNLQRLNEVEKIRKEISYLLQEQIRNY